MNTFINFKNYTSGIGEKQRELLDFLESLSATNNPSSSIPNSKFLIPNSIQLVVPPTELSPIWQKYNFPLWSEHCDPVKNSKSTGWISTEQIKEAGGIGTMLNHSEHRLPFSVIKQTTEICHEHNLKVLICCENEKEAIMYSGLHPEFLAYEPPELIANKTQSVTSKTKEIRQIVSFLKSSSPTPYSLPTITFLIGAGIRSKEDIKIGKSLGAQGILISSSIMEGSHEEIKKLLSSSM
jgi:triosephosphate isomerase (TIM)